MSVTAELSRLAPTKDWVADSRSRRTKEESSDEDEGEEQVKSRAGLLICDSSYSLPPTNWLRRAFCPPVPIPDAAEPAAVDPLRASLVAVLPLIREVYAFVSRSRTGHIDWQAVAQSYNEQGKGAASVSAAEAKRLWRAAAYARVDAGDDETADTPDGQHRARTALAARLAPLLPSSQLLRAGPRLGGGPSAAADDDAESDFEGYIHNAREREANVEQTHPTQNKTPPGPTARLVGRPFPPPPGVVAPQPPADGAGPLDLGLEPPRKAKALAKKEEEEMSLNEAMRLTVTSKPWTEDEDKRLASLVAKHGVKDQPALEKGMKRSWGSIRSRISILQTKGLIPKQEATPPPPGRAKPPPAKAAGVNGGVSGGVNGGVKRDRPTMAGLQTQTNADGLLELIGSSIDTKLWPGAAAAGWVVVEQYLGGHKFGNWRYFSPGGTMCKTRAAALEVGMLAGTLPPARAATACPPEPKIELKVRLEGGGARGVRVVKPKLVLREDRPPPLSKKAARELVGRSIEVFWDGDQEWYVAEVREYNEAERAHSVHYVADGHECVEKLSETVWRGPLPKPTARTAKKARL